MNLSSGSGTQAQSPEVKGNKLPLSQTEPQIIAGDSVHWYDKDGKPVWSIVGKNGKERSPFTKEAIAMGCVPGVTTITKQVWSYGLQEYIREQGILAALTLPRMPEETDEEYVARVKEDSKAHARDRRDEGSELHKAIDQYVLGQPYDTRWKSHISQLILAMGMHGYSLSAGKPQVTFATGQYGGTADLVFPDAIFDWKTKKELDGKKKLAYDDQGMQLVAYDHGISRIDKVHFRYVSDGTPRKLFNVFVGCNDGAVQVYEWSDPQDIKRCWTKFQCLLGHWWADQD